MRIQQDLPYPYVLWNDYFLRKFPQNILQGFDPTEGDAFPPFIGINLGGFDSGNAIVIQDATYSCISDTQINWVQNSGVNIARLPIIPAYIFKEPPTATTPYSPELFSAIWTDGSGDLTNVCGDNNNVFNVGTYMSAVQYLLSIGSQVIIDAHENVNYLCTFGGQIMSPAVFVNMWRLIVTYVITQTVGHENVWFELFNEPVAGEHCTAISTNEWNTQYVVPAIQAIRQVELTYGSAPHRILATTYGNYSGLHAWVQDGTLQELVSVLTANGLDDSVRSHVVLACHQYCDSNYSGIGKGCDATAFNPEKWGAWIQQTTNVLLPAKMQWFMSEGNVNCGYEGNCAEMGGGLYPQFLQDIVRNETCIGFAVWLSNLGDNYGGANMGGGPQTEATLFDAYRTIYPHIDRTYNFRPFYPL